MSRIFSRFLLSLSPPLIFSISLSLLLPLFFFFLSSGNRTTSMSPRQSDRAWSTRPLYTPVTTLPSADGGGSGNPPPQPRRVLVLALALARAFVRANRTSRVEDAQVPFYDRQLGITGERADSADVVPPNAAAFVAAIVGHGSGANRSHRRGGSLTFCPKQIRNFSATVSTTRSFDRL